MKKKIDYSIITYNYLEGVKNYLETENRFFPPDDFCNALKGLMGNPSFTTTLDENSKLFRARVYKSEKETKNAKGSEFEGYGPEYSGIPKIEWSKEGRMNPSGIQMLYVSTGETTCAKEIGSASGESISIALFKCKREMRIADFSNVRATVEGKKILRDWIRELLSIGYGGKDYVITQYISMLCKKKGFDGIKYRSKYAAQKDRRRGNNIAFFSDADLECIGSRIHRVKSIALALDPKRYS